MPVKDHYRVLNISPTASAEEIKKAFRKLALLHHPDKANGNIASIERYAEIQEAYGVLSDRKKRSDYHYSRYRETASQKPLSETADDVLKAAFKLKKQIAQYDPFRIDKDLVYFELKDLLRPHNLRILQEPAGQPMVGSFTKLVLECLALLEFNRIRELCSLLEELTIADHPSNQQVRDYLKNSYLLHSWNRYKIIVALLIAILLCLGIYSSR